MRQFIECPNIAWMMQYIVKNRFITYALYFSFDVSLLPFNVLPSKFNIWIGKPNFLQKCLNHEMDCRFLYLFSDIFTTHNQFFNNVKWFNILSVSVNFDEIVFK